MENCEHNWTESDKCPLCLVKPSVSESPSLGGYVRRLFVRPHEKARKMGLKTELQWGWVHRCQNGDDHYSVIGACKHDAAFERTLQDIENEYGDVKLIDLR